MSDEYDLYLDSLQDRWERQHEQTHCSRCGEKNQDCECSDEDEDRGDEDDRLDLSDPDDADEQADGSPGGTPWAVICREHGQVYLTYQQYIESMSNADAVWTCPICGCSAQWDDENYERRGG